MIINDSITGLDCSTVLFIGVVYANAHTFVHTEAKGQPQVLFLHHCLFIYLLTVSLPYWSELTKVGWLASNKNPTNTITRLIFHINSED